MASILLADDSAVVLSAVAAALRAVGHEVLCSNCGADTICLLSAKPPPDLLILDLGLPGMDGYEVLAAMGPTAPPVIIISGTTIDPCRIDVTKVARVLLKPFDQTQLLAVVADVLAAVAAQPPHLEALAEP